MSDSDSGNSNLPDEGEQRLDFEQIKGEMTDEEWQSIFNSLHPREADVITATFGLDGSPSQSFDETSASLGVTRERVRQIVSKLLSKIKHPSRSQILRDYLDQE